MSNRREPEPIADDRRICELCGAAGPTFDVFSGSTPSGIAYAHVGCTSCGFVFNQTVTFPQLVEYYRTYNMLTSSQVVTDFATSGLYRHAEMQRDFILDHLPTGDAAGHAPSAVVLDVGSGEGLLLGAFAQKGWQAVGVEPSDRLRGISVERFPDLPVASEMFEDFETSDRFGVIAVRHVLEHVLDPQAFLRRAHDLLEPGGSIYIEVPDVCHLFLQLSNAFTFEHINWFSVETLSSMLRATGFDDLVIEEFDQNPEGSVCYPVLRCVARASDSTAPVVPAVDAVDRVRASVEAYREAYERLTERVADQMRLLAAEGEGLAIFGAGMYGFRLLEFCPDLRRLLVCFVDNDPDKQAAGFLERRVIAPADLKDQPVGAVIVATMHYEEVLAQLGEALGDSPIRLVLVERAG